MGISGAQGSGKSTLANDLVMRLADRGVAAATLSLDDLYRTKAERLELARTVHPLFATRGVPGTHDIDLGLSTIAALERGEAAPLPRFDKARDDRLPQSAWPCARPGTRVLVLEGWCLGARPQAEEALAQPINALEALEDPAGVWRAHANAALGAQYAILFARIDLMVMLRAPGFGIVARWRGQQEEPLRRAGLGMSEAALARFIAHYQRITEHLLQDLPARADLVLELAADRSVQQLRQSVQTTQLHAERPPDRAR